MRNSKNVQNADEDLTKTDETTISSTSSKKNYKSNKRNSTYYSLKGRIILQNQEKELSIKKLKEDNKIIKQKKLENKKELNKVESESNNILLKIENINKEIKNINDMKETEIIKYNDDSVKIEEDLAEMIRDIEKIKSENEDLKIIQPNSIKKGAYNDKILSKKYHEILNEIRENPSKYITESKTYNLSEIFLKLKPSNPIKFSEESISNIISYLIEEEETKVSIHQKIKK